MDRFVSIARIIKTRGIKGEVSAELLTDFPERFTSVSQVRILLTGNQYWEDLERYWFHQGRIILKFRGRDLPDTVHELVGGDVQIPERERVPLPQGSYYDSDLIDCRVLENQETLGQVVQILKAPPGAAAHLVIAGKQGKELMVPMVRKFVTQVDVEKKIIRVKLPKGLLELAFQEGSTQEEKRGREQRKKGKRRGSESDTP